MEITEGIHLIPEVRGANAYLVVSQRNTCVIDTGMPGNASKVVDYVRSLGKEQTVIGHIILTHSDIDHSGSAAKLKELTNAKVAIHEADAPRLSGEKPMKEVKGAFGIAFKLMRTFMRFTPVRPDLLLKDSDNVAGMKVIHTPGHTEGSISLYLPGKVLFVGDALRTNSKGLPELPPKPMTLDMERAEDSIRRIAELQYDYLLPGHGPPITSKASDEITHLVESMR